jgi:hypothetical protein
MNIYWDMDDVLLDTTTHLFNFHGIESPFRDPENCGDRSIHKKLGMDWWNLWGKLPQSFWESIPKMEWCDELIEISLELYPKKVFLLTSPIPDGKCSAGKQLWVNKNLKGFKTELIIAHRKWACVGPDGLLIDDSYKNEEKFKEHNKLKNFHLFPSYQNRLWAEAKNYHSNPQLVVSKMKEVLMAFRVSDARPLIDCPKCGAKPPVAHTLGGGPHFDGVRVCGKCGINWEDSDRATWVAMKEEYLK